MAKKIDKKKNKVLSILLDVFLVIVILLAAAVTVVSLNTKENGIANIFGYIPLSIQSGSMNGTFEKGDLLITKKYDDQELKVGDIVSFFAVEQDETVIKTHRIVKINNDNGVITYITKGDANKTEDSIGITKLDVVSIYDNDEYTGKELNGVGNILDFFKSKYGFLCCIILPLFVFFVYQLYKLIIIIIDEKKKEALREIEDAKNEQKKA